MFFLWEKVPLKVSRVLKNYNMALTYCITKNNKPKNLNTYWEHNMFLALCPRISIGNTGYFKEENL